MESEKCYTCKKDANETSALFICNYCNNYFHQNCFGLLPERASFVRTLHQTISPICSECDINTRIEILDTRIKKLRQELNKIIQNSPFRTIEHFNSEVIDRLRRAKNIIVYNLPEPPNEITRIREDRFRIIHEILSFCCIHVTNIKVQRLGLSSSNTPRPLRIVLNREEDVYIVLKYRSNCTSGLKFGPDRTVLQRKILKCALEAIENLHQQGYNNLRLKFIRGFPYILQLQQQEEGQELEAYGNVEVETGGNE